MSKKRGKVKMCIRCRRPFYEYLYQKGRRKFCSSNCANKYNAKHLSEIRIGPGNPMFGKRPWNYIDGRGGKRHPTAEYWIWRREVFNRDKNTCQDCKNRFPRKYLVAHHIKPWKEYPTLRYVVSNGLTLCRACHNKIDRNIKRTQYH